MNQPVYIRSAACISAQHSFGLPFPQPPVETIGTRLTCIEPDYGPMLDAKLLRRMSRIIRMGCAAGLACLRQAGVAEPGAIITGTAYGCLADTGSFLQNMIERREETLQPATFIQSTHNTVGAQIALLLHCTRYNNSFVHRGFSFESALLDSVLLLAGEEADTVLVGGVDEITDTSHALLTRFGLYRRQPVSNLRLFHPRAKGTIAGEGATFFVLAAQGSDRDLARLEGIGTLYHAMDQAAVESFVRQFLADRKCSPADIDLVITGDNGDVRGDMVYRKMTDSLFPGCRNETFKALSGEYPTAVAFGVWLAANLVRGGAGRTLIYNQYLGIYHTIVLLSSK